MSSVDDTVPLVVLRLGCESVAEAVVTGKEWAHGRVDPDG